jgi:hypothetical protein
VGYVGLSPLASISLAAGLSNSGIAFDWTVLLGLTGVLYAARRLVNRWDTAPQRVVQFRP